MAHELLATVKFNSGIALVLKEKFDFIYRDYGNLIIGVDESGTFVDCLYYQAPTKGFKAFAGREFDIEVESGEVIHCNGQWWAGGSQRAERVLKQELISITYNDVESLKRCYVYFGACAIKSKFEELVKNHTGKLYEYYEYEKELKNGFKKKGEQA